jgi:hypothetical protein
MGGGGAGAWDGSGAHSAEGGQLLLHGAKLFRLLLVALVSVGHHALRCLALLDRAATLLLRTLDLALHQPQLFRHLLLSLPQILLCLLAHLSRDTGERGMATRQNHEVSLETCSVAGARNHGAP